MIYRCDRCGEAIRGDHAGRGVFTFHIHCAVLTVGALRNCTEVVNEDGRHVRWLDYDEEERKMAEEAEAAKRPWLARLWARMAA